jgi:cell division protein FtsB
MPTLASLGEKKSSSKSWIWVLTLSGVIFIAAVIVWWQVGRLKKKISKLEGQNAKLKNELQELKARQEISVNDAKSEELSKEIARLSAEIIRREATLKKLRDEAEAKQEELDNNKPW